jgi:hypothetical protein
MAKRKYTAEEIVTVLRQVESRNWQRQDDPARLPGGGHYGADVLPVAQGVRRVEARAGQTAQRPRAGERAAQAAGGRARPGEADPAGRRPGKLVSPARRRSAVAGVRQHYHLSERHACRLLLQGRGTKRYAPILRRDEDALTRAIISLASRYGRYGYRRITALVRDRGWAVGKDRVARI